MATLKSIHTLCPYLVVPLIQCAEVNGEHILASALGTPESFKLDTDASENQRLNIELDVPMLKNEMIQLLAVARGVTSRSGKDFVVLNGVLGNGDKARLKLTPEKAEFSILSPVETDPQSGMVLAVKGFGSEAKTHADEVIKKYKKKGVDLDWLTPPIHEACTDNRCRQLQQRFVDIQPSFKADSQLAKASKPAVRPLYHPSVLAQPLAALNASSGNPADDAPLPQVGPASLEVVAFVGVQLSWSFTGTP